MKTKGLPQLSRRSFVFDNFMDRGKTYKLTHSIYHHFFIYFKH